jgi:hypothetical protein
LPFALACFLVVAQSIRHPEAPELPPRTLIEGLVAMFLLGLLRAQG